MQSLTSYFNIQYSKDIPTFIPSQYYLTLPSSTLQLYSTSFLQPPKGILLTDIIQATVIKNVRMSKSNWSQNIFHLTLSLPTINQTSQPLYQAGDVCVIYPINPSNLVNLALSLYQGKLQTIRQSSNENGNNNDNDNNNENNNTTNFIQIILQSTTQFQIIRENVSNSRKNRISSGLICTLEELFTRYLDISGIPQRSYFEQLSFYTTDEDETEKLRELASAEGVDLYQQYCTKEKRGYIEILSEFKSCNVPLDVLIDLIPPLLPRHYSIASSGIQNSQQVNFCFIFTPFIYNHKLFNFIFFHYYYSYYYYCLYFYF